MEADFDKPKENQWPTAVDREGAMPLTSLTKGCRSRLRIGMSVLLCRSADFLLYVSLKIGVPGTRALESFDRRSLGLVRAAGLRRSTKYMGEVLGFKLRSDGSFRLRVPRRVRRSRLQNQIELQSASGVSNVVKFSTPWIVPKKVEPEKVTGGPSGPA